LLWPTAGFQRISHVIYCIVAWIGLTLVVLSRWLLPDNGERPALEEVVIDRHCVGCYEFDGGRSGG